jgi:predicted methyltransferase
MRFSLLIAVTAFLLTSMPTMAACDGANCMDAATEAQLKKELADARRKPENAARDQYRHPLETLKFFGLKNDMTVLEVAPGGGWWTEFLAPVFAQKGQYIAGHPAPPRAGSEGSSAFSSLLASDPSRYGKTKVVVFNAQGGVPPGSVDLVLTFRNLHNWMGNGNAPQLIAAMHRALRTGGHLGIEEHRASGKTAQDPKAESGYVREDFAIQLIESQGFKLVSKSEVNANPKDTKDYPGGVWTLPPSFAEGAKDREKYSAIGESDRFTLLFQKVG